MAGSAALRCDVRLDRRALQATSSLWSWKSRSLGLRYPKQVRRPLTHCPHDGVDKSHYQCVSARSDLWNGCGDMTRSSLTLRHLPLFSCFYSVNKLCLGVQSNPFQAVIQVGWKYLCSDPLVHRCCRGCIHTLLGSGLSVGNSVGRA